MQLTSNILLDVLKDSIHDGRKEGYFEGLSQDCVGIYRFQDIYYIEFPLHDFLIFLMSRIIIEHDLYGGIDFKGNIYNLDGSIPFKDYSEEKQVDIIARYCHDFEYLEGDLRDFANTHGGY